MSVSIDEFKKKYEAQKAGLLEYLKLKVVAEDWHGVADAAMDLREVEAAIITLTRVGDLKDFSKE